MTPEEKAKAYDKVAKEVREFFEGSRKMPSDVTQTLEHLFPELKESSEDEKMRKALIEFFKTGAEHNETTCDISDREIVAWLEKQDETDETKAKKYIIDKGYPIDANGTFPTYEELYNIIKEGIEQQNEPNLVSIDEVVNFLNEQLVNDKDEMTGEPFINFQNYGAFKESFISFFKRKMLEKQDEQKSADKSKPFDKYEGLTDFERTLADICIGWIGEEIGWKEYIKENADVLLKIAIKKFNSAQDAYAVWNQADESYVNRAIDAVKDDYPMTATWLKTIKERIKNNVTVQLEEQLKNMKK